MKKFSSFLLSALILITFFSGAASANGFSEDPDAVEQKLKSVLMLEVYSGVALFDDSGSVIGITTSTLTRGQNINLAVHISEAVALYENRDGSRTEMEGYRPGRSARAAATPKPTPTPSPTSNPIVTSETSGKIIDIDLESDSSLKIIRVTMRSNGDVYLDWSGGTGPYKVRYQIVNNCFQDAVLYDRFYWLESDTIKLTHHVIHNIIPDYLYRIDVIDELNNRASAYFCYNSKNITGFDVSDTMIGLQIKNKSGSISSAYTFSCSAIENAVKNSFQNGVFYGIYLKVGQREDLDSNYNFRLRLVFELPNGDIIVQDVSGSNISSNLSNGYTYWEFIDCSYVWERIYTQYNEIPAGKYKFSVYMDNTLLTTRTITFK